MGEVFVEHIVKRRMDITGFAIRMGAIFLTLLVFFVGTAALGMVGITLTALMIYVCYLAFIYTSVEYEYSLVNGELTIEKILGQRKRKHITEIELKNAELIAPANSGEVQGRSVPFTKDYSSGSKREEVYAIIYNDKDGQTKFLFEPTEKMIDAMYHVRPSIVKKNG
ncbi:MAG: DUF6106 family protein [Eubacterium sp.]|nr:DUF6106 family protein [Eubacterium sp.]